jgi:hypothetical protein
MRDSQRECGKEEGRPGVSVHVRQCAYASIAHITDLFGRNGFVSGEERTVSWNAD